MSEVAAVQEGARWRHAKPSADEVANWFKTVPLDEGMKHEDFISGVVVIKASEKVKRAKADGRGTEEGFEDTHTPYVRVDSRVAYFRKLAELRGWVAVIEPVKVPRIAEGAFRNDNFPDGFWWHIAGESQSAVRSLCATWRVAYYETEDYFNECEPKLIGDRELYQHGPTALREGRATKQVTGSPDPNGLAKAETGAVGRALGMAGILILGTGVATAEDMTEYQREQPQQAALPEAGAGGESEESLNARLIALQGRLRPYEEAWHEFANWWTERAEPAGWTTVMDAPIEVRRGMALKMERLLDRAQSPTARQDSSPAVETPPGPPTLPTGADEAAQHEVA